MISSHLDGKETILDSTHSFCMPVGIPFRIIWVCSYMLVGMPNKYQMYCVFDFDTPSYVTNCAQMLSVSVFLGHRRVNEHILNQACFDCDREMVYCYPLYPTSTSVSGGRYQWQNSHVFLGDRLSDLGFPPAFSRSNSLPHRDKFRNPNASAHCTHLVQLSSKITLINHV